MVNAIPDVTQGLLKRPAGKFVASLSDGTNNSTLMVNGFITIVMRTSNT